MHCISTRVYHSLPTITPCSFIPPPRNAMDNVLPEYANGKSPTQGCTCTNGNGSPKKGCDQGLREQGDGQSCLWWSQGCSIGCEKCVTAIEGFSQFNGKAPQAGKIGFSTRYCNSTFNSAGAPVPLINATLPKHAWTLNMGAVEGSKEDAYRSSLHELIGALAHTREHIHAPIPGSYSRTHGLTQNSPHSFNPWRAPGYAPVVDPCGQAGGKFKSQHIGGDSVFTDNKVWGKFPNMCLTHQCISPRIVPCLFICLFCLLFVVCLFFCLFMSQCRNAMPVYVCMYVCMHMRTCVCVCINAAYACV